MHKAEASLKIVTAEKGQPLPTRVEPIWRTLGVEGLPSGYTAAVAAFHPKLTGQDQAWSEGYYSDFQQLIKGRTVYDPEAPGSQRQGVNTDLIRRLVKRDPEWAWQDRHSSMRMPLAEVWQLSAAQKTKGDPQPWALTLALHEPRLVLELPLRTLLVRHHRVTIDRGLRLEMSRMQVSGSDLFFNVSVDSRWPSLQRRSPDEFLGLPAGEGRSRVYWCAVVLLDDAHRVARSMVDIAYGEMLPELATSTEHRRFGSSLDLPKLRMKLTGMTMDEWSEHVRVQVWWPEPRGTVDLQLPGKEMARLAGKKQG
jgi:hypothetical protein